MESFVKKMTMAYRIFETMFSWKGIVNDMNWHWRKSKVMVTQTLI